MDFEFSEEQRMVIDGAKKFAEKDAAPRRRRSTTRSQESNVAALKQLGELGYLGMTVPEEYGGTGLGAVAYAGAMIEFSKVDAGRAVARLRPELPGQRRRRACSAPRSRRRRSCPSSPPGEWLGCFSLTEAGAGSDPARSGPRPSATGTISSSTGRRTSPPTAGSPTSSSPFSARTRTKGAKGISAFLVTKDTPGFERRQAREQARHPLLEHDRDGLHRLPRAGHEPPGRGEQGPEHRPGDARRRPDRHRRPGRRASPRPPSRRRSSTPRSASSSASRWPSSRRSSSCSPTWPSTSRWPRPCSTASPG